MCAQKTAPKKTTSVETLRNNAMDWLALQIARPGEYIENTRLKRHVQGPLGSANEVSLRAFFKRESGSELYITFDSMSELVKFDKLLTKSGLFENIDCAFVKTDGGKLDVTVTLDHRELTLAGAKKLLNATEKKLLEIARKESGGSSEFKKEADDDFAGLMDGDRLIDNPFAGSNMEKLSVEDMLKMPTKKKDAGFRGWYMSSSTGNKVPIFSTNNWEKNEKMRKELWEDLVNNGECTFKVNKRILRKFGDAGFREQFLGLIRSSDVPEPKLTIDGNEITITREISKRDVARKAHEGV